METLNSQIEYNENVRGMKFKDSLVPGSCIKSPSNNLYYVKCYDKKEKKYLMCLLHWVKVNTLMVPVNNLKNKEFKWVDKYELQIDTDRCSAYVSTEYFSTRQIFELNKQIAFIDKA